MVSPAVGAWIEEPGQDTVRREGAEVAPLAAVTDVAREREVVRRRRPAVLLADDVVDAASDVRVVVVDQAVLTV